jgi:NADH-quinone oxidoreductase subunit L
MPFHSWIPMPRMTRRCPSWRSCPHLSKNTGDIFLARITLDMFDFQPGTRMSVLVMSLGAITILLAVLMAVVQKDYKRLLSFHAISQVGYMVLGIGTALPIGIAGGLFHMINHAMYKSCLFLTSGSVERAAGTTDLSALGGLGKKMPVTFACFFIAAASISGVPPFQRLFLKGACLMTPRSKAVRYFILPPFSAHSSPRLLSQGRAHHLSRRASAGTAGVRESPWPMLLL